MNRQTFRDRVAALFKAKPNKWIDALEFQRIGGNLAFRTRISECRTELGMQVENRVRTVRHHTALCPNLTDRCTCGRPVAFKVSEYMYVVPVGQMELSL